MLDILRGFALLGMILVHFHQNMETEATGLEDLIGWFTWVAVETKSWGTFAFLFGVGFAVQLRSFEAKGMSVVAAFLRRLSGLAVFGLIAEACFGFHVLLEYAIWGLPLLFVRRWSQRALLIAALVTVAFRPALGAARAWYPTNSADSQSAVTTQATPQAQARQALRAAEAGDDYGALFRARLNVMRVKYSSWSTYVPGSSFALFLIGLLALRRGVFHEPRRHVRLITGWMTFGFVSWGFAWLARLFPPPVPWAEMRPVVVSVFGLVQDQWLCFTYIGALVLLTAFKPLWLTRLAGFGAAGRMALTNYMLQVAVLDYLASGYGAALRIRPLLSLVGTILLFGSLVAISSVWLASHRFGPLERLWRSFTYLQK